MHAAWINDVRVLVVIFHHTLHLSWVEKNAFAKLFGLFAISNGTEIQNLKRRQRSVYISRNFRSVCITYLDISQAIPLDGSNATPPIESDLPNTTEVGEQIL